MYHFVLSGMAFTSLCGMFATSYRSVGLVCSNLIFYKLLKIIIVRTYYEISITSWKNCSLIFFKCLFSVYHLHSPTSQYWVVEMCGECDCTITRPKWRVAQISQGVPYCIFQKILWPKNVNNKLSLIHLQFL